VFTLFKELFVPQETSIIWARFHVQIKLKFNK
jgi:hypothetical protein